ncbi:MAG: hypothetical protein WCY77_04835 [Weeksellaceae bacterium]
MRIPYKKRHVNTNLFFGILWLSYFLIKILLFDSFHWIDYGCVFLSFAYLTIYFYEIRYKYVTIQDGVLSVNELIRKKVNLNEINQIKRFAGDYIIQSDKNEVTINTQIIDTNSLPDLIQVLDKLDVERN